MSAIVGIDAEILYVSTETLAAVVLGAVVDSTILNAPGTGYAEDETITLTDGNNDCVITVNTIGGSGEIETFTVTTPGTGYVRATGALGAASIAGVNASFDILVSSSLVLPEWSSGSESWTLAVNNSAYSWTQISERNEFSISISVDTAEHKVFVTNISNAWVEKARLYMDWSGSLSGYYDDATDDIFTTMKNGKDVYMVFFDTKEATSKYWIGKCILTTVDHTTANEDFATLDVDFEGNGKLYRSEMPAV